MHNKKIVICVTGSVAAIETPKLVRELRRQGAVVHCVMSKAAQKVIHPDVLHWASDNRVITKLTGECEHVKLCGLVPDKADLVLIAPSTANTIGKIASGIDDTPVTTVVSTAIGSKIPIIIVAAMHYSMYDNPFVQDNIKKLKKHGIDFIAPKIEENKAKFPDLNKIINIIDLKFRKKDLKSKNILVTAGATIEQIDSVRYITNKSSGKMGIAIANEAYARGANVTLISAKTRVEPKYCYDNLKVQNTKEMLNAIKNNIKKNNVIIHAAAVSDFTCNKTRGKLDSKNKLELKLKPTEKILEKIKTWNKKIFVIGFKAEHGKKQLVEKAKEKLRYADLIVANDISKDVFNSDFNEVIMIDKNKNITKIPRMHKKDIANKILEKIK
jgi:phosphopantothenoylcysteine decarboxylase/phosphopantothenate--cysteine ligase